MANFGDDEDRRPPEGVQRDDDQPKGFVRLAARFRDLKVKTGFFANKDQPANGTIDAKFQDQSFRIDLDLKTGTGTEKFRVGARQMPGRIVPEECSYKLEKQKVIISLKKAEPESWNVAHIYLTST